MKTAYELVMERLAKDAPSKPLTDAQKAELAKLDEVYKSKLAEREVFLESKIAGATASGDFETIEQFKKQLASDRKTILDELEEKKEAIRRSSD
ncbi:MAG: hypothetical protein K9N52_01400 [Verrucomicrobia bacterium]|nr:hypothetical protein [Verrucomicrobiota bacterium]